MLNRISIRKARLTQEELQDIRRYMQIFVGQSHGHPSAESDHIKMRTYMERVDNLTFIPPSLAAFLVEGCEDYEPTLWYLLPPTMGPSFREILTLFVKDYGSGKICREAGISRRTYYNMFDPACVPAKDVIIRIAMAKGLSPGEAHVLLNRAGYEFDKFCDRDLILDYCFQHSLLDIDLVNDALRRLGYATLRRK